MIESTVYFQLFVFAVDKFGFAANDEVDVAAGVVAQFLEDHVAHLGLVQVLEHALDTLQTHVSPAQFLIHLLLDQYHRVFADDAAVVRVELHQFRVFANFVALFH